MKNKMSSNWIVKNLIGGVVFVLGIVIVINIVLGALTHHGQEIAVPDMTNMSVQEARSLASDNEINAIVTDSVYVRRMERGAVFSQNPKAGTKVKQGRKVRLTINAVIPKQISMPNLVGLSMRQAKAELSSKGLSLGSLIYVSDIATNNVLKQLYRNREIAPGASVESGAVINLVVGLNEDDFGTFIPSVIGMKYMRAVDAIHDNSLNVAALRFDKSVKNYSDSLDAVVYRQSPAASEESVTMGQEVTLYLTVDEQKSPTTPAE